MRYSMKMSMAMLLAFCLLLGTAAWAQDGLIGCMKVIKCEEWVSLREQPDAKSACLVEVPLGALVENCREESKAFHYAEYGGMSGYIMAQYLEAIPEAENYLGDLVVAAQGTWTPMYADTTQSAAIVQWMAPGEQMKDARKSLEGFVYGTCRGVKGYVAAEWTQLVANVAEKRDRKSVV